MSRLRSRMLAAALVLAALPGSLSAQQAGTITGRVTDQATSQPLGEAQVFIVGTTRGSRARADGTYQITGVPAGNVQVRAIRIGYAAQTRSATVTEGQSVTVDFALSAAAAQLDQITITATGEELRKREVGSNVGTITTDSIAPGAVQNLSQVLNGRAAGVTILQSGGTTGTGARVRIRGANSVSLSNEPLLIVDGVRVNNNPSSNTLDVGGQSPSRLNDINPEDIESVEIFKGPAATALYGTAAANGIIQITTKRGRAGRTQWNAYAEGGTVTEFNDFPANFGAYGDFGDGSEFGCDRVSAWFGDCTQDSLTSFNPLETNSPFRDGNRMRLGLSASGGTERATFFISGDQEEERGVYVTSGLKRTNLRSNIRAQLTDKLDANVTAGYLTSHLRLPQNDNNFLGYISNGIAGKSFDEDDRNQVNEENGCDFRDGGYDPVGPCQANEIRTFQDIERFTGGITSSYRPLSFLSFTGNVGMDVLSRLENETFPAGAVTDFDAATREGSREANRTQVRNWTANVSTTATFNLRPNLVSTTSGGFQYQREEATGTGAFGAILAAGTNSLNGTASRFAISETYGDNRTVGMFVQQQFGLADRLFLTAAVRGDDNSAFGSDFGFVYYPAASVSWVIGEEDWFPKSQAVSSVRLRSSYGKSGLRPSNRDALTYFIPVKSRANSVELSGISIGGIGLPDLKPERVTEVEVGLDAGILGERLRTEFTYFTRRSQDALIARTLPTSVGAVNSRFENIGEVSNKGFEWLLNASILDRGPVRWNATIQGSRIDNKLEKLGEGISPIIFGLDVSQQHREGYSLGSYFGTRITGWEDSDENGDVDFGELTYSDTAEYLGNSLPKHQGSFSTDITFFNTIRVNALLDYRGGYKLYNATESFRCAIFTCRAVQDTDTPIDEQRAGIAYVEANSFDGYIEDAAFAKLREVAVTLMAPRNWSQRLGVGDLSLTLSGRNLGTWTDYKGLDPEVNSGGQANFSSFDFLSQPQVRYFTARLNIGF